MKRIIAMVMVFAAVCGGCEEAKKEQQAKGPTTRPAKKRATLPAAKTKADQGALRHVVLFKFKDDAAPDKVKAVEEAFAALPGKVSRIKAFEWGTDVTKGARTDGFTHCFLVTFADAAGRKIYLPHPDHKAFGKLLGPVLDKVLVIDYFRGKWGRKPPESKAHEGKLRHLVLWNFKVGATVEQIKAVEDGLAELAKNIPEIIDFEWGTNASVEGLARGYTDAVLVTFEDEKGLDVYLPHQAHQGFVKILTPVMGDLLVIDYVAK